MSRRLISLRQAADHIGVDPRTVRNYIGAGHFPCYRVPGVRGVLVDLDEVDAAMRRLPARLVRPAYGSFGPKAVVITLPAQPVVVPASTS